ncbi:MAG: LysM peptidoglycan-binding domain-containing protein [Gemmatimonadota bacterium]
MRNGYSRMWIVAGLAGLGSLSLACAAKQIPPPAEPELEEAAGAVPDRVVAEAAEGRGLDPDSVVEKKREAERRVEALDEEAEREFLALFGPDPLGLAREPRNADRYEIPLETNARVEGWIDYFRDVIPERFALYLRRLGRYGPMIRAELAAAGLPEDLVYLALIESGLNPNAYSRARAAGMWQFIRSTGRLYDLQVDYWVDERMDPLKATDAAIRHLADLFDEFGSWYLAAAAYNGGATRVRRAMQRTGSADFWELADRRLLRRETRNYVPKLIAAAIIAKHPEAYGFADVRPDPPLEFEEAEVPDATSFDVLAAAAGTDEATIKELNPHFRRHVTPPSRHVKVRVPVGSGAKFAANYAKIPPGERVTWLEHVVTRGETLGQIARRYRTSVTAIRAANGYLNPRRLQIGQRLIVPRAGGSLARAGRSTSPGGRSLRPVSSGPTTVTVRRGDTLWSIARRYNVSTRELMAWNSLSSAVVHPGDRLRIRR